MVDVENLIFEGKCFIITKMETEDISKLKDIIKGFMNKYGYVESDSSIFFKDNYLSMEFSWSAYFAPVKIKTKIKKRLGLLSSDAYSWERYSHTLKSMRRDLPIKICFLIARRKINKMEGFLITIRTEPVLLYCIRQLGYSSKINDFEYDNIAVTNKHFINQIMIGLWTTIIEEPKSIKKFVKTPLIEKLEQLEINETARLLKRGKENLEKGGNGITDGLADLRSAIEKFIFELIEKIGEKPLSQQKLKENLRILEDKKNINKEMAKFISKTLNNWLWQYLSDRAVHKREDVNVTDAKFLYSLTEDCMEYMLNKILYGI